MAKCDGVAGGV